MKRIERLDSFFRQAVLPRLYVPPERYSWKGMLSSAMLAFCLTSTGLPAALPLPPVSQATFGVGDTLLIVVVALIVFGPKKLPEISRQVGKLLYEFRKASNDFKFQIEEELRAAEQSERQKELSAQAAATQPATPIAITAGETVSAEPALDGVRAPELALSPATESADSSPEDDTLTAPTIQPPASGLPVSTRSPYRAVENAEGGTELTAAGESLDEPQILDELQANAQDAIQAAAADSSYNQSGDAVPTHHG
jgi:sec-independent protein translocase protein TatB